MGLFVAPADPTAAIDRGLRRLAADQKIAEIDRMTGLALAWRARARPALAAALGAFMSQLRGRGYVCLRLDRVSGEPLWRRLSAALTDPGAPAQAAETGLVGPADDSAARPLIVDDGRLYFHRAWWQERELARHLRRRAAVATPARAPVANAPRLSDEQRLAVQTALSRSLCVVSGGPGSGKTTVAGAIVRAFLDALPNPTDEIGLAAPTGKAAARLAASVNAALATAADTPALRARTLHRLLGWNRERASFRFGTSQRLPLRLLIIDEVSMVDLDLMHALLCALKDDCRLVLLGDRDQLTSVQPGNVLADICAGFEDAGAARGGEGCVVSLRRNYRFDADSGIGALAAAIKQGDADAALRVLRSSPPDLVWRSDPPAGFPLPAEYLAAVSETNPAAALERFDRFRVLCAHRRGPHGSETINRRLVAELRARDLVTDPTAGGFFENQFFVVIGNHYGIGLFNGDQGIIKRTAAGLQAFVAQADGECRALAPHRLPEIQPGFALTVHRSQGSEFERVLLILPHESSPLLTRGLLYTAVTRGRRTVEIWGTEAAIRTAVEQATERGSGLADRLRRTVPRGAPAAATPSQGELF